MVKFVLANNYDDMVLGGWEYVWSIYVGVYAQDVNKLVWSVAFFWFVTGIYCGPLRLLAWEVAKRLNKAKVPCDLITGQERDEVDGAKHKSVTVEMADVTSDYDCAVIDEIQACQFLISTLETTLIPILW